MIINITPSNFGGRLRNGDMIGALNFCTHIEKYNPGVKFHFTDESIQPSDYCIKFRNWLTQNVDLLVDVPGNTSLSDYNINLWEFRTISGDIFKIKNQIIKKKICIFPLFDAPYNLYRNWTVNMVNDFIEHYMHPKYYGYEKLICANTTVDGLELRDFKYSFDFLDNIKHLTECNHYIGGDTGMSHFVSVLDNDERVINYYYSTNGLLCTTPFYIFEGKGNLNMFTNQSWRTDSL